MSAARAWPSTQGVATSIDARPGRAAARADALLRVAAAVLIWLGCALLFAVSPMLLAHWGVPYDTVGGSAPSKVHPATWAMSLGLLAASLRFSSPFAFVRRAGATFPGLIVFFLTWLFMLWAAIFVQKMPFTPMIDSFFLPLVTLLALSTRTGAEKRRIALTLHLLLAVNAVLGLSEYLLGFRLTPFVAGEYALEADWRSTALLGHPLSNALAAGVYMIVLTLGGGRDLPAPLRPALLLVALASMIAFGGRTALVLSLATIAAIAVVRLFGVLRGDRFDARWLAGAALLAPALIVGLGLLHGAGFFDQLLERFVNDQGSAKARLIMLGLFDHLSWEEIVFGPNPDKLAGLQRVEGVEYGLESFFVAYVLTYGLIASLVFFAGVAAFCRELVRASTPRASVPILFFFAVAATSVSLSAKTTAFGMLVALLLTMLRPAPEHAAA